MATELPPEPGINAWGLKPTPPSPIPAEVEIGLTADEDGWGETLTDLPISEFLRHLATASLHIARYWLIRSNLFRTRRLL